jgi:hypothetical protein
MKNKKISPKNAAEKICESDGKPKSSSASKEILLTVPECDGTGELLRFADTLIEAFAKKPKSITLRFVGVDVIPPDSALLIYDILSHRPYGIKLITQAWSRVMDSGVLVWLAGDVRSLRPTTFLRFKSLENMLSRKERRFPWDDDDDPHKERPVNKILEKDYKTVLALIDEHLNVCDWADKIIEPSALDELGLLEGNSLDEFLRKCFAETETSAVSSVDKPVAMHSVTNQNK